MPEDWIPEVGGEVRVCDPLRPLTDTFGGHDKPEVAKKRSGPARVMYELTQLGPMVRLRLVHEKLLPEDMEADPDKWEGVNNGWPTILNSLKSLLETGTPISFGA